MFPMTITVSNAVQLSAIMAVFNVDQIIATAAPEAAPAKAEKVEAKKPVAAPKAEANVNTPATAQAEPTQPAAVAEKKADAPASPSSIDYKMVSSAILEVSSKLGREKAIALLASFGVTHLKNATPDQFPAILASANEALGA